MDSPSGHMGQKCQSELMVEIYSKSLVRAIKERQLKPIKVMNNVCNVCKQTAVLVVCINTIGQ